MEMKTEIEKKSTRTYITVEGPGLILSTVSKAKGHPRQNRVQRFVEKQGKIRKELTKRPEKVKIGDIRVVSHTQTQRHPYLPTSAPPFLGLILRASPPLLSLTTKAK
jgi:hypothetical protein